MSMLRDFSPFGILMFVTIVCVTIGAIVDSVFRHRERMARIRAGLPDVP